MIDEQNGHRVDAQGEHLNIDYTIDPGTLPGCKDTALRTLVCRPTTPASSARSPCSTRIGRMAQTWQEELRFASKQIGDFNYVRGRSTSTTHEVLRRSGPRIYDLFGVPAPAGLQPGGYNNIHRCCAISRPKSPRPVRETNYKFTDATTLTVGARITRTARTGSAGSRYSCSNWHRPRAPSFRRSLISNWAA